MGIFILLLSFHTVHGLLAQSAKYTE